jgi:hypothetical protein
MRFTRVVILCARNEGIFRRRLSKRVSFFNSSPGEQQQQQQQQQRVYKKANKRVNKKVKRES